MKEKHFAYKIYREASRLVCTHYEFEEDKMLDLLKEIKQTPSAGLYWIFKQFNGKPEQALCIIDCSQNRIYYHHSGEVENLDDTIKKLSR
ncbi:hypothetical protein [Legionella londiniensis]|uniref:Uncharacterized protein n=1 Tax=Legionella londiniensis TaxID=45068 RepID=A0A0W0VPF9_9GAMM|nr:hypothetical protein [Legionella londiniensis]KTD21928.1 hypothetical protein Llon_1093 [Legionella londiniensis]STX92589.1 Uncharacterised protein [Legionella londiniensis]